LISAGVPGKALAIPKMACIGDVVRAVSFSGSIAAADMGR
jgi:hypothetical protein